LRSGATCVKPCLMARFGFDQPRSAENALDSLPSLIGALTSKDLERRRSAAYQLAKSEDRDVKLIRPLVAALGDPDGSVRHSAGEALERFGSSAVGDLRKALQDRSPMVRAGAAGVLSRIGPKASEAVEDLIAATADSDVEVRRYSVYALGSVPRT